MNRALVAALVVTAACSAGQDPSLDPRLQDGPTTTSRPLAACPDGGPDETTPPAGCLDVDGTVLRP